MTAGSSRQQTHKAQVYLVEDHTTVRLGLAALIAATDDLALCGEASTYAQAIAHLPGAGADVALVDISLPDGSGLVLVKELRRRLPRLRIGIFSMHAEIDYAPRALRAGAAGYITKSELPDDILKAIRRIAAGQKVVSERVLASFLRPLTGPEGIRGALTDREIEVVELYGMGCSDKQIAIHLRISERAVAVHRANLKRKLGLSSSGEFLGYCVDSCRKRDRQ